MNTIHSPLATPPWFAFRSHRNEWYVRSATGHFLATMATGFNGLDRADARMMAAAPQLMTALQELLLTAELNLDEMEPATLDVLERARQAVAYAAGQSDHPSCIRLMRAAPHLLQALDAVNAWSTTASPADFPHPVVQAALTEARGH
jgi:hypothetical protein